MIDKVRVPMMWIVIPAVIGFLLSFFVPISPGITTTMTMFIGFITVSTINRYNKSSLGYRLFAWIACSLFFYSLWPKLTWWVFLPGFILTLTLSLGLNYIFRPKTAATADVQASTTPSGEATAIGINMHSPRSGQSTFIDTTRTIENLGRQANADELTAMARLRESDNALYRLLLDFSDKLSDGKLQDILLAIADKLGVQSTTQSPPGSKARIGIKIRGGEDNSSGPIRWI